MCQASLCLSIRLSIRLSLSVRHTPGTVERKRENSERDRGGRDGWGELEEEIGVDEPDWERDRETEGKSEEVRGKGYKAEMLYFLSVAFVKNALQISKFKMIYDSVYIIWQNTCM